MGTVTIGGRVLDVPRETLGFRKHRLLPWRSRVALITDPLEDLDAGVDGIMLYVGHHEGVDRAFVEANATLDTLGECISASHAGVVAGSAQPGEAKSP